VGEANSLVKWTSRHHSHHVERPFQL